MCIRRCLLPEAVSAIQVASTTQASVSAQAVSHCTWTPFCTIQLPSVRHNSHMSVLASSAAGSLVATTYQCNTQCNVCQCLSQQTLINFNILPISLLLAQLHQACDTRPGLTLQLLSAHCCMWRPPQRPSLLRSPPQKRRSHPPLRPPHRRRTAPRRMRRTTRRMRRMSRRTTQRRSKTALLKSLPPLRCPAAVSTAAAAAVVGGFAAAAAAPATVVAAAAAAAGSLTAARAGS